MPLKAYIVSDGPPSMSVKQCLAFLKVPAELIDVSFINGDHLKPEYEKLNPQREIPVIDDDGFCLGESNAILQYICDKYKPGTSLYPTDPKTRALVNHRLCFNLSTYYPSILMHSLAPIFFDYQQSPMSLKKVHMALGVFNTYLERLGSKYAAADHLTIADFQLFNATMNLEVIDFDFSKYAKVQKWYNDFKQEHPEMWKISKACVDELKGLAANPPDLSGMNHPYHPIRKVN